ncbi:HNH endonuclease, partial [Myxococcota bacterium]|nr:HNH endonuclease [Myxococcota bacterium]
FAGYVIERCQRSGSWGRDVRGLAQRLRERSLHEVRAAVLRGELGTSMAELVSKFATPENEAELLARARVTTVRALRAELTGRSPEEPAEVEPEERRVRVAQWVRPEDLAAVTASRMLVEYLTNGARSDETFVEALLGEGETTLLGLVDDARGRDDHPDVQRAIEKLLEDHANAFGGGGLTRASGLARPTSGKGSDRDIAAAGANDARAVGLATESRRVEGIAASAPRPAVEEPPVPASLRALDYAIVEQCAALARRSVELARGLLRLSHTRVWQVLGFESVVEWASERLGLSRSSFEHYLTLAKRMTRSPALATALDEGRIGHEAALLIGRVVGRCSIPGLVEAWIERAERRTYKHLREEVRAVSIATAYDCAVSRRPPSEEDLEAVAAFERKVQSGEVVRPYALAGAPGPQTSVSLSAVEPSANALGRVEPSADDEAPSSRAPSVCVLRLSISADLWAHFRAVGNLYWSVAKEPQRFVGFLCASLWRSWLPFLEAWDDKWKHIFQRDRHRCTSPVCERHDVTAHHVRFQAHGGTDEPDNVTSLCPFCHLEGIHRGRLRATGSASKLTWTIGREPILRVQGREKLMAAT